MCPFAKIWLDNLVDLESDSRISRTRFMIHHDSDPHLMELSDFLNWDRGLSQSPRVQEPKTSRKDNQSLHSKWRDGGGSPLPQVPLQHNTTSPFNLAASTVWTLWTLPPQSFLHRLIPIESTNLCPRRLFRNSQRVIRAGFYHVRCTKYRCESNDDVNRKSTRPLKAREPRHPESSIVYRHCICNTVSTAFETILWPYLDHTSTIPWLYHDPIILSHPSPLPPFWLWTCLFRTLYPKIAARCDSTPLPPKVPLNLFHAHSLMNQTKQQSKVKQHAGTTIWQAAATSVILGRCLQKRCTRCCRTIFFTLVLPFWYQDFHSRLSQYIYIHRRPPLKRMRNLLSDVKNLTTCIDITFTLHYIDITFPFACAATTIFFFHGSFLLSRFFTKTLHLSRT